MGLAQDVAQKLNVLDDALENERALVEEKDFQVTILNDKLTDCRQEIATLKSDNDVSATCRMCTEELSATQQELEVKNDQNVSLQSLLREKIKELRHKQQDLALYKEQIGELSEFNEMVDAILGTQDVKKIRGEMDYVKYQNKKYMDQLQSKEERLKEIQEEVRRKDIDYRKQVEEVYALRNQLMKIRSDKNLSKLLNTGELAQTQTTIATLKKEIQNVSHQKETLERQLTHKQEELKSLESKLAGSKTNEQKARDEIAQIKRQLEQSYAMVLENDLQVRELRKQLLEKERRISKLEERM